MSLAIQRTRLKSSFRLYTVVPNICGQVINENVAQAFEHFGNLLLVPLIHLFLLDAQVLGDILIIRVAIVRITLIFRVRVGGIGVLFFDHIIGLFPSDLGLEEIDQGKGRIALFRVS